MVNEYIFVVSFFVYIYHLFTELYPWKSDQKSVFFFIQTLIDLFIPYIHQQYLYCNEGI